MKKSKCNSMSAATDLETKNNSEKTDDTSIRISIDNNLSKKPQNYEIEFLTNWKLSL